MPTPFTHLAVARRLLADPAVPPALRALCERERGAFLLGHVAADARVSSGIRREDTHFYAYDRPIDADPWRVMLDRYPALRHPASETQAAFVAAYIAHLVMDALWSQRVIRPYFAGRSWATDRERFLMLNVLLVLMDERDYADLVPAQRDALAAVQPRAWAPFLPDAELAAWGAFIASQLPPGGTPATLDIIGARVGLTADALRALLRSPARLDADLWAHVPRADVAAAEAAMYETARRELTAYLEAAG